MWFPLNEGLSLGTSELGAGDEAQWRSNEGQGQRRVMMRMLPAQKNTPEDETRFGGEPIMEMRRDHLGVLGTFSYLETLHGASTDSIPNK